MAFRAFRSRRSGPRRKPSLDFSLAGLVYTTMMLFIGLAAVNNSAASLLFGVFGLMIGVLGVSGYLSRVVLRKLEVRRILPEFATVGQAVTVQYECENRKRYLPSLSVTIGEFTSVEAFNKQPQAYLLHAAAGMSVRVPALVVPVRRGLQALEQFQVSTSFPFGFIKRAMQRRRKDSLLVHPPIAQVDRRLLRMCLSADQGGSRMRPRRGGTDEFFGVKEFRTGENPRWIHWRRSARTGTLIAREMAHIAPPRLLIVVDTHLADRGKACHAAVERAIAMAASLALRTVDEGLAVGLCAYDGGALLIRPGRGKRHCRELLAALAQLPLNTACKRDDLVAAAQPILRDGTTPILFTPAGHEPTLTEQSRGNWIILPADSELSRSFFHFEPGVDFEKCVPLDQAPREN